MGALGSESARASLVPRGFHWLLDSNEAHLEVKQKRLPEDSVQGGS